MSFTDLDKNSFKEIWSITNQEKTELCWLRQKQNFNLQQEKILDRLEREALK